MILEMKVPSPGESITEVQIARWIKSDGEYVEKDEEICEIDSDKATLTINAESSGLLKTLVKEGDTVAVGTVVCSIDTEAAPPAKADSKKEEPESATKKAADTSQKATNGAGKSKSESATET